MKDLNEVVDKVKCVEDGVNNLIIPILKDSIKDGNHHNKRLFVINMMLVVAIMIISITSLVLITKQNDKYIEFMEQYDITSSVYQETSDSSTINDGIRVIK